MSAQSHTPGPWPLTTMPTSAGLVHMIGNFPGSHLKSSNNACIYVDGIRPSIDDSLPRAQEMLANARLMAAAPELLAAVEALMDDTTDVPTAFAMARAAITKARG